MLGYDRNGSYILPSGTFNLKTGKHAFREKNPDPFAKKKTLVSSFFNFDDPESLEYKKDFIHIIGEMGGAGMDKVVGLRFVLSFGEMMEKDSCFRTFYHDQTYRRLFDGKTIKAIPARDYRNLKAVCEELGFSIGNTIKLYVYK